MSYLETNKDIKIASYNSCNKQGIIQRGFYSVLKTNNNFSR